MKEMEVELQELTKKKERKKKHLIPELKFLHGPAGHRRKQQKPWGLFMLCIAVGRFTRRSAGTAAPAKTHPCQSLPACSPHPLSGLERERWGAGGRVQGEAGGRAARLELPDMGTRLTAGSNWLPSESLPLPLPDKVCTQPLCLFILFIFFGCCCSVQLTRNLG